MSLNIPAHLTHKRWKIADRPNSTYVPIDVEGEEHLAMMTVSEQRDDTNQHDSGSKRHHVDRTSKSVAFKPCFNFGVISHSLNAALQAIPSELTKNKPQAQIEQSLDTFDLHRKISVYWKEHGKIEEQPRGTVFRAIELVHPLARASLDKHADHGTLLHLLVKTLPESPGFQKHFGLLKFLLANFPELYGVGDDEGNTVLVVLINKRTLINKRRPINNTNDSGINPFVDYFVKTKPEQTAEQLKTPADEIFRLIPLICGQDVKGPGSLYLLLPYLTKDQFYEQDGDENTVLHLVARYKHACDEEPESQEVLKQAIEVITEKYSDIICRQNKRGESPYLHRVNTAKAYFKDKGKKWDPDVITHFLQDLCMHKPLERVTSLLYGATVCTSEPRAFLMTA